MPETLVRLRVIHTHKSGSLQQRAALKNNDRVKYSNIAQPITKPSSYGDWTSNAYDVCGCSS
jgi:hypothetical protein